MPGKSVKRRIWADKGKGSRGETAVARRPELRGRDPSPSRARGEDATSRQMPSSTQIDEPCDKCNVSARPVCGFCSAIQTNIRMTLFSGSDTEPEDGNRPEAKRCNPLREFKPAGRKITNTFPFAEFDLRQLRRSKINAPRLSPATKQAI